MKKLVVIILLISIVFSCSDSPDQKPNLSIAEMQEALFEANIKATKTESKQIESYISKNKLTVVKTGTGLRYVITKKGLGKSPKKNDIVQIKYIVCR